MWSLIQEKAKEAGNKRRLPPRSWSRWKKVNDNAPYEIPLVVFTQEEIEGRMTAALTTILEAGINADVADHVAHRVGGGRSGRQVRG